MSPGALRAPLLALALGLVLAVALLAAVEGALRATGVPPPEWPRAGGMGLYPGLRTDPLLGPVPVPGWSGTWSAMPGAGDERPSRFRVTFDDRGLRAAEGSRPERPERRILFAGDSVTFGWGVDDSETFVARLDALQESAGARLDLANAAFPGHSAVAGRHWLRERGLTLDPDLVVLGYGANNAFRFTVRPDADRYRLFALREALLRLRIVQIPLAHAARRKQTLHGPRSRELLRERGRDEWRRVAPPDAFEDALRAMVGMARSRGARVLLLGFPRAMQVSAFHRDEDAAVRAVLQRRSPRSPEAGALDLLEVSCLEDPAAPDAPERALRASRAWRPTRPSDPRVRERLARGAIRFAAGDLAAAEVEFRAALALAPDAPLAHYDLGVTRIANGRTHDGLEHLAEASRLSCSIFLQYSERLWRVAVEEGLPVVDVLLLFQTGNARPLFLDPAHLTPRGHDVLARALRPMLRGER